VLYYTTQNEFSVVIYELKTENFLLPLNGSIVNKCRDNELILGMLLSHIFKSYDRVVQLSRYIYRQRFTLQNYSVIIL